MSKFFKLFFWLLIIVLFIIYGLVFAFAITKFNYWRLEESEKLLLESQKVDNLEKSLVLLQKAAFLNPSERTYLSAGIKAQEVGLDNISAYYLSRVKTADGYMELGNAYYLTGKYDSAEKVYKKSLEKDKNSIIWLCLGKNYLKKAKLAEANYSFEQANKFDDSNLEAQYYQTITYMLNDNDKYKEFASKLTENYRLELEKIVATPSKTTLVNRLFLYLKGQGYPQLAFLYLDDKGKNTKLDRDGYLLLGNEYFIRKNYAQSYSFLLKAKEIDLYYPQTYQHLVEIANLLNKKEEAKKYQEFLNRITW
jgi:tetratricopeptide (TPR) repeat protein